mmetsp:Transcript_23581/g.34278  ORF Transcript_23581/g.34278 Transcript_23581/m.34278 type:complete len:360 (-) Transcript_23581:179-1258(-)
MLEALEQPFIRATCMVILALLVFNLPSVIYKARLFVMGFMYLIFCNDKSFKAPSTDPGTVFVPLLKDGKDESIQSKTIIFIRHGESTWNDTFNKGSHRSLIVFVIGYIPGLMKSLMYEMYLLLTGKIDSWFYDSPLSTLGLGQTEQLAKFLQSPPATLTKQEKDLVDILNNDASAPASKFLASPLRRAISTVAIALRHRLEKSSEAKITIHPSLQEIARNPDTLSITPPHTPVTASWIEQDYKPIPDLQHLLHSHVDVSGHIGNKPIDTNGLKRMTAFNEYVFSSDVEESYVIVGGHSIWFRTFFKTFLPYGVDHVSKKKKIVNCGAVALTLMKTKTEKDGVVYMVDPKSIQVIYGGFN